MRNRITDWKRKTFGDLRYGPRPTIQTIDGLELPSDDGYEHEDEEVPQNLLDGLSEEGA